MSRWIRSVPWLLALLALAVPLIGSGFAVWPVVTAWLVILGLVWLFGRHLRMTRAQRIVTAVVALPVLFLLAFEGGWWLIPADLTWLAVEILDRPGEPLAPTS